MNFKTTGILFLLVVIVVGFIYYTETQSPPPAPTLAPQAGQKFMVSPPAG